MAKSNSKSAITPIREDDYPGWYQSVVQAAQLAENSPVRGCMVIKPWGYSLWENMQAILDRMFKETGHTNAYFPLLIPVSFLEKEAEHVEGFAKECAVVTHHRLEGSGDGKLVPAGKLEEPMVIRPTSETIIGHTYAKWVQSYRDLPILINQWANVMRWEMRTRIFLRTSEFLWQEGHTVHATKDEAVQETLKMLDVYADFAENYMAMPVIKGLKTRDERFPGAVDTYSIEAMMLDGKALQAGTSHFLGQNFAKASEIKYLSQEGKEEFAWTTSWGVSTRLVGGLIMTHGDDDGVIIPPKLAPQHIAILPIIRKEEERAQVLEYVENLAKELREVLFDGAKVRVHIDARDIRGGEKAWGWIKQGVPLRVEAGPRDIAEGKVMVFRRDQGPKDREAMDRGQLVQEVAGILQSMQDNLFTRAKEFRDSNSATVDSLEDFEAFFRARDKKHPTSGFVHAHWCEDAIDHPLLEKLKVTPRCIPVDGAKESGTCIFTGKPSPQRVVFARSY